jgi:hypothetical protein
VSLTEVDVGYGEGGSFIHPEAVVIDEGEEGMVPRGVHRGKEALALVCGQVCGSGMWDGCA